MNRRNWVMIVVWGLIGGCAAHDGTGPNAGDGCKVSTAVRMRTPEGFSGEAAEAREYSLYGNGDRSILWLAGGPFVAGESTKRWWFRPAGEDLVVTGRRMDAPAPPAVFEVSPGRSYPHKFLAGTVKFPSEGCWDVNARAGASEARFVVRVLPATTPSAAAAQDFELTQRVMGRPPVNSEGGPNNDPDQLWYVNSDRSIWMYPNYPFVAKERIKTGWFRPANTIVTISGRRLDGDAPALVAQTETFMAARRFQPSVLIFPTEGIWEINAKAGTSAARFVVKVEPAKS